MNENIQSAGLVKAVMRSLESHFDLMEGQGFEQLNFLAPQEIEDDLHKVIEKELDVQAKAVAVGIVMLVIEDLQKELGLGWWANLPVDRRAEIQKNLAFRVAKALCDGRTR